MARNTPPPASRPPRHPKMTYGGVTHTHAQWAYLLGVNLSARRRFDRSDIPRHLNRGAR